MIYSSHDDQILNILDFIEAMDFYYGYAPYSSVIFMELHYDTDCIATKPSNDCFTV